jgi:16S rRNA (adenine1518-N6/adenine1519-N6)-dimethyltransferase
VTRLRHPSASARQARLRHPSASARQARLRHKPVSARQARRRFGQHFLAPAWADKVVEAIAPSESDRFLEIGPGPGALTLRLAPQVAHLTAVEVDRDLAAALEPRLPPHVDLIATDFLNFDLSPLLARGPLRIAGNLPYNISSPILFKLLQVIERDAIHTLIDATVMLQREVADRLVAKPGTKEYGVLTIFTAIHADVERVLTLPPGAFRPAPKVHSAVVRLTFKRSVVPAELRDTFDPMVKAVFTQRRKTLANALRPFAESIGRTAVNALQVADIDPIRRAETLDVAELVRLASALSPSPSPDVGQP